MLALHLPDLSIPLPKPGASPPDPALLAAARAEGEEEGFARGFAEGVAEGVARQAAAQAEEVARALAAITAALTEAAEAGRRAADEAAGALAAVLVAAMEAALPGAAARAGADLVSRVLVPLLPALAGRPEAVLRVAPELAEAVAGLLPPEAPPVVADATIPSGDARVEWRDGAWIVSRAQRWAAAREALRSAGFSIEGEADEHG